MPLCLPRGFSIPEGRRRIRFAVVGQEGCLAIRATPLLPPSGAISFEPMALRDVNVSAIVTGLVVFVLLFAAVGLGLFAVRFWRKRQRRAAADEPSTSLPKAAELDRSIFDGLGVYYSWFKLLIHNPVLMIHLCFFPQQPQPELCLRADLSPPPISGLAGVWLG